MGGVWPRETMQDADAKPLLSSCSNTCRPSVANAQAAMPCCELRLAPYQALHVIIVIVIIDDIYLATSINACSLELYHMTLL